MTLNEPLLQKLSEWRPEGSGRQLLAVSDPASGWTASVTAERVDATGCLVWELALRRDRAGTDLAAWAKRAASRVTGLVEPLKVVEVDPARGEALLRSDEPSTRADQLFYYEAILNRAGSATVRRYQASHQLGSHRQQHAFSLTHEVLAKLAADLTEK